MQECTHSQALADRSRDLGGVIQGLVHGIYWDGRLSNAKPLDKIQEQFSGPLSLIFMDCMPSLQLIISEAAAHISG